MLIVYVHVCMYLNSEFYEPVLYLMHLEFFIFIVLIFKKLQPQWVTCVV